VIYFADDFAGIESSSFSSLRRILPLAGAGKCKTPHWLPSSAPFSFLLSSFAFSFHRCSSQTVLICFKSIPASVMHRRDEGEQTKGRKRAGNKQHRNASKLSPELRAEDYAADSDVARECS
jgi:hypothetical protein